MLMLRERCLRPFGRSRQKQFNLTPKTFPLGCESALLGFDRAQSLEKCRRGPPNGQGDHLAKVEVVSVLGFASVLFPYSRSTLPGSSSS
jgi:hypothetical protein